MVLYRVPNLVCSDCNSSEGAAIVLVRRQPDHLLDRILMVSGLGRFYSNSLQTVLVQQVSSEAGTCTGVAVLRLAVFLEHPLNPDSGTQNQSDYENDEDDVCHRTIVPTILQKVVCRVVLAVQ